MDGVAVSERAIFYYDLGSPYAYLAAERVNGLFAEAGVQAPEWQPLPSGRYAYRFATTQLNVHGPGESATELARIPVAPGGSDLCFVWAGTAEEAARHLESHGIEIETGPVKRFGARGNGTSVYFRDPDGSLLEFISYPEAR
ncbi:MAG: VOC family virulence protein [Actinobacteria bacterium]|nr:MAG: VOC family virulence protein [Actinomycetota bacterium]